MLRNARLPANRIRCARVAIVAAPLLLGPTVAHAQVVPNLNISDVTLAEGNPPGTTTFTFAVTLTAPAGPGGVTFDIATADGTAQDDNPVTEDNDYVGQSLTGQAIAAGSTGPYNFSVTVNRDLFPETNETFFVNVTNVVGANAADVQGLGTINNDDVTLTPIHDIQSNGASSPLVGIVVTIRGVVTGVKSNGFFVQEEEADYDADSLTSEGMFVFTSGPPPAAAAFSAQVEVTGTVAEFVPSSDPQQPPMTQLTSPTVVQLAVNQPLPNAILLSTTFPDPNGPFDQLEGVEHMRVSASSITVTGPSNGLVNEINATGTSNGRFHGVVTGVPRPFREAGIQAPDIPPSGSIPPIPRWDFNPERLRIESAGLTGQPAITVRSGDLVGPIVGPLDYALRSYAINPDGTNPPVVTLGMLATTVSSPAPNEIAVASVNLRRFFDTVDDPGIDEPVLTPTAFDRRLSKASIAVRNHLGTPDIIGVQEVENLATLQALAARIQADAIAAGGEAEYIAFLVEGNDFDGLDVGFLVKANLVTGGVPRVSVTSVTQVGASTTWIDPATGSLAVLNDRPPLVLEATVNRASTASFPIVVIVNDLLGLTFIGSNAPVGLTTLGDRVRRKRQAQAEFLANYVQQRLTTDPGEHLAVIGSFNAFEVNDGYVDVTNVVAGTPPPDNETVVPGDGVDLVNPDLMNLVNTPAPLERYSVVLDGNAANLGHVLASAGLIAATSARRIEHPRIGADYPETEIDNVTALRFSDRDPVVAYFATAALTSASLSITKTDSPDPVIAGQTLIYAITVTNDGPDAAESVSWTDSLPAGTTFVSLSSPGGWTCTTPPIGAGGVVSCSIASLGLGEGFFTLIVAVAPTTAAGTVLSNTATISSTTSDPIPGDGSATATTSVATAADLSIAKIDTPDPVVAGQNLTYTITVSNSGPSVANSVVVADTLPAGTTFVSLSAPGGWSCTTPAVGAGGTLSCSIASLGAGSAVFTLTAATAPTTAAGTVLSNTATVSSTTSDPSPGDESATATTTVATSADLSIAKIGTPDPVVAGQNLTYTITVSNSGPPAASVALSDTLPAGTTFVALAAPPGWSCTTPAVGAGGTVSCAVASLGAGSGVFTLTVAVAPTTAAGTILTNTATVTSASADPAPGNNSATASTLVSNTGPGCDMNGDGSPEFITAAGESGGPHLRVWSISDAGLIELPGTGFFAYDPAFSGGVFVACRDLTGDGVAEIVTAPGAGGGPHVRVWTVAGGGLSELAGFFAYDPAFTGGVAVAAGDLTGDGVGELITGAGPGGGPHVRVWSVADGSVSELAGFFAFNPAHSGGVDVAAGDLTGDGVGELITGAGPGGGPHVRVWSVAGGAASELASFFAYDPAHSGGVTVAVGDLTGDGIAELITGAGPGGGPHVRVWSVIGSTPIEIAGFFAYDPAFAGGVSVAVGDVTGDGIAELMTGAGPGGGPHVRVWSLTAGGVVEIASFYAYDPAFLGGVRVAR